MRLFLVLTCACSWLACSGANDILPDADSGSCPTPLDEATLDELRLGFFDGHVALQPGQTRAIPVGVYACCVVFEEVPACVTWSVEPADMGARMEPDGTLVVDASVEHGRQFTVIADVENGRRTLTLPVYVYTPEGNPLVGTWSESERLECDGSTSVPENPVRELRFLANGSFQVTWTPFEVYVDYWGDYSHDLDTGALALVVTGGNYVPPDMDGEGSFAIQPDDSLELGDIWLGSRVPDEIQSCGHRFAR